MIYSFSHRTDGPAFYWSWFLERLRAGTVQVRNPYYPEKVSTYDLSPDVCDGFTFTSKDYSRVVGTRSALRELGKILDRYPTLWSYTITPYVKSHVEPRVPDAISSVETMRKLSSFVGRERLTWLYSPLAMMDGYYDVEYHKQGFEWLCEQLSQYASTVSVATLKVYEKVARNAPELRPPHHYELQELLPFMVEVAEKNGMRIHACPGEQVWGSYGFDMSPCLSLERFAEINGREMRKVTFREGSGLYQTCPAGCMAVRDLAPYNSCPHDCVYCYANSMPGVAEIRHKKCDVRSPMLLGNVRPIDVVSHAKQRKYLV